MKTFKLIALMLGMTASMMAWSCGGDDPDVPDVPNTPDFPEATGVMPETGGPKLPDDPKPGNDISFVQRILLLQHTGVTCGHCPIMITALRNIAEDPEYKDRFTLAALHSYETDPLGNNTIREVSAAYMSSQSGWPYLSYNFKKSGSDAMSTWQATCTGITASMDAEYTTTAPGISSAAKVEDDKLTVSLGIKADVTGKYRVGAWLLEDGILYPQTNYHDELTGSFTVHNNVLRQVSGRQSEGDFTGIDLGEVKAGEYAATSTSMTLKSGWKTDNCQLLIFVTRYDASTDRYICANSNYAPISGTQAFEYKK